MTQNRTLNEAARLARAERGAAIACAHCASAFLPYRNSRFKFCSVICGKRSRRQPKSEKQCAGCGASFTPTVSMKSTYCTPECKRRKLRADTLADPVRAARHRAAAKAHSKTDRYRHAQANFKAKRRAAERTGSLSWDDWLQILLRFGGRCAYCGAAGKMTRDHVKPLATGGEHSAANVVPACRSCNSAKCDADWSDRVRKCP